jgi:hypothetical protein
MNRTKEFNEISREFCKSNNLKMNILNPPRDVNEFMRKSRMIREEIFNFKTYLREISNSYLGLFSTASSWHQQGVGSAMGLKSKDYPMNLKGFNTQQLGEFDNLMTAEAAKIQKQILKLSTSNDIEKAIVESLNDLLEQIRQTHKNLKMCRYSAKKPLEVKRFSSANSVKQENPASFVEEDTDSDEDLNPQLKQLFEHENEKLLEELVGQFNEVRNISRTMNEIAQMQSELAVHLSVQKEVIADIGNHLSSTHANIEGANTYLANAKQIFGGPKYWVLYFFFSASVTLLLLDYFYS